MKKAFIAAAALAALAAGGAAMAQGSAQCQADPDSCSSTPSYGYRGPNVYVQPGVRIAQGARPYAYNQQYAQPRYRQWQRTPYARTRRDHDGDGVPNWRDRYPNDPARY